MDRNSLPFRLIILVFTKFKRTAPEVNAEVTLLYNAAGDNFTMIHVLLIEIHPYPYIIYIVLYSPKLAL